MTGSRLGNVLSNPDATRATLATKRSCRPDFFAISSDANVRCFSLTTSAFFRALFYIQLLPARSANATGFLFSSAVATMLPGLEALRAAANDLNAVDETAARRLASAHGAAGGLAAAARSPRGTAPRSRPQKSRRRILAGKMGRGERGRMKRGVQARFEGSHDSLGPTSINSVLNVIM